MNNPKDYYNYSGGAEGADITWDNIGRKYDVVNHKHWRPSDLKKLSNEELEIIRISVEKAADVLKRPKYFKGIELVQRNWLQIYNAEAIFAISYIIHPGELDFKGFENKTGKEIVSGGTGWAIEMAIQMNKFVYIFDMNTNKWYWWNKERKEFSKCDIIPILTKTFAGIGSRALTSKGIEAIENVYKKTFKEN